MALRAGTAYRMLVSDAGATMKQGEVVIESGRVGIGAPQLAPLRALAGASSGV